MFLKFFLSFSLLTAQFISSMDDNNATTPDWAIMFPGVVPAANPADEWAIDSIAMQIIGGMHDPLWNGTIQTWGNAHLNNLNNEQLTRLTARIHEISPAAMITFSEPTVDQWGGQEIHLRNFNCTIEVPFGEDGQVDALFEIDFLNLLMSNAPRRTPVSTSGMSLGQAWTMLKEMIDHYRKGIIEAEFLFESIPMAERAKHINNPADLAKKIAENSELWDQLFELYNQANAEFDKPQRSRDMNKMEQALQELIRLLRGEQMHKFILEKGINNDIIEIMRFVAYQPALAKLRAVQNFRNIGAADQSVISETTAEMLNRLLTKKPNKDIAAAAKNAEPGLIKTVRLDNRLWNVFKINDPQNAAIQNQIQQRQLGYQWNNWQLEYEVMQPMESAANDVMQKLNLKEGSYAILIRQPSTGSHIFRVIRFNVASGGWNHATNQPANQVRLEDYIGLIEIRPAQAEDRTALYDPMHAHGRNSIRNTMMEHRIHAAMSEHGVRNYSALPQNIQQGLRADVERYNHERDFTRLENEHLENSYMPPEERTLAQHEEDRKIHELSKKRAHKLSSELNDRLAQERAWNVYGSRGDLTEHPEQNLQIRVHELVAPRRIHSVIGLPEREKQFFGENHEGGYLDTVETAVAHRQERFNPKTTPERIHFEGPHASFNSERLHLPAQQIHGTPYNVAYGYGKIDNSSSATISHMAAPAPTYDHIADALADYDMK